MGLMSLGRKIIIIKKFPENIKQIIRNFDSAFSFLLAVTSNDRSKRFDRRIVI